MRATPGEGTIPDMWKAGLATAAAILAVLFAGQQWGEPAYMAWRCRTNLQNDLGEFLAVGEDATVEKCTGHWKHATCMVRSLGDDGVYRTKPWTLKCTAPHFSEGIFRGRGSMQAVVRQTKSFMDDVQDPDDGELSSRVAKNGP